MNLTLFTNLIFVFYISWIFIDTLFWVGLFQEKEYRFDRLKTFFLENVKAKGILFSPLNLFKIFAIFFYIFIYFENISFNYFYYLIYIIYFIQFFLIIKNIFERKIKRPKFTLKAFLIFLSSTLTIFFLIFNPLFDFWFWVLIMDKFLFLIIYFYVLILYFPTEIVEKIIIIKAIKKLNKNRSILKIAISGSYGKTSTKEYIAQILSSEYVVSKTPESNNTPIGVARAILKSVNQETEIFVVEMGAYKLEEIAELSEIVKPTITVTTGISDQHLSLYGNMKNIINSESELFVNLPKNALSIFNGNSQFLKELIKRVKNKKIIYINKKGEIIKNCDYIYIKNIKIYEDKTTFDFYLKSHKFYFETSILGKHCVENIAPAIFLAFYKNIAYEEIYKSVKNLIPFSHTLKKIKINENITIIDDTFNSSPESVLSASNYLNNFKIKKIIVLTPLVELGKNAKTRHLEIGKKLGLVFDEIYLTNDNFYNSLLEGYLKNNKQGQIKVLTFDKIAEILKKQKKAVILFEGKEAGFVLNKIL